MMLVGDDVEIVTSLLPRALADHVNTAARLAGAAARQGEKLLCTEEVFRSINLEELSAHGLSLIPVGQIPLKGMHEDVQLYRLETTPISWDSSSFKPPQTPAKLFGRTEELDLIRGLLAGHHHTPGPEFNCKRPTTVLLEGADGMGRSALAECVLWEALGGEPGQRSYMAMMFHCHRSNTPLIAWQRVLSWLLEQDGCVEAEKLAWLMVSAQNAGSCQPLATLINDGAQGCT